MFAALREAALVCVRCPHLARSRTQVVFGVGNPNAELMFVGEAPGADEDAQGEPFVGRAGQLLTKIIEAMGFRREDVYIANVLKCRPDMPPGISGNRKPTPEDEDLSALARKANRAHQTACDGRLRRDRLGGPARRHDSGEQSTGTLAGFSRNSRHGHLSPAYLLRNQSVTEKRKVWEDMLQVLERLGKPISESNEGFSRRPSHEAIQDRCRDRDQGETLGSLERTRLTDPAACASCRTHLARISVAIQQPDDAVALCNKGADSRGLLS